MENLINDELEQSISDDETESDNEQFANEFQNQDCILITKKA